MKDICTLEYIPEILEAGICSLKIEGRMKKPEYVALVTAMYRKYVDLYLQKGKAGFKVDPKDKEKLLDLYNRGGSHGGYYHTQNGRDMISIDRPNHAGVPALQVVKCAGKSVTAKALVDIQGGDVVEMPDQKENFTFSNATKKGQSVTFTTHQKQNIYKDMILNRTRNESLIKEIQDSILNRKVKEKIQGKLMLSTETAAKLELSYKDKNVVVYGEKAEAAMNQPMDAERLRRTARGWRLPRHRTHHRLGLYLGQRSRLGPRHRHCAGGGLQIYRRRRNSAGKRAHPLSLPSLYADQKGRSDAGLRAGRLVRNHGRQAQHAAGDHRLADLLQSLPDVRLHLLAA